MNDEPEVLQLRIQIRTFEGRQRQDAQERVRRSKDEKDETDA